MEVNEKTLVLIRSRVDTILRLPVKQHFHMLLLKSLETFVFPVQQLDGTWIAQFTTTKCKNEKVFQSSSTLQLGDHKHG